MINSNDANVNKVILGIHEALSRKNKRFRSTNETIVKENQTFTVLCGNFDIEPAKCANILNDNYGYDMNCYEIIQIFRNRRLSHQAERKEMLQWASKLADLFQGAINGNKSDFEKYESFRKTSALKNGKKHDSQERIAVLMLYKRYPQLGLENDLELLFSFGNILSKYFFYDISDVIADVYGYPQYKDSKVSKSNKYTTKMPYDQLLARKEQLEIRLDRTNMMLQDLQDEFEEQLEASKTKELTDFFTRLNSEKYGCILDELLSLRKGIDELRKSSYDLPLEINGLLIMSKKLIQFIRDNHIEPIMKIGLIKDSTFKDVEFCDYEGTPFNEEQETKKIKVISSGWVYKDKDIQISRPKVREEK